MSSLSKSAAYWNRPFSRYEISPTSTIHPQVGFELSGLKKSLEDFCLSHGGGQDSCTIGYFIYFYEDGAFLETINEIKIKKLTISFDPGESSPASNWVTMLSESEGILSLADENVVSVKGLRLFHYQGGSGTNYATPLTAVSEQPRLVVKEDASDYGIETIMGYQRSLRIAYLDYSTLLQMHLSYKYAEKSDTELKFIFTGAEINHGEMVSPLFQHERFVDWYPDFSTLNPSVTATLKVEALYIDKNRTNAIYAGGGREFIPAMNYPFFATPDAISMPGVMVLPPCRRYWHTINQILSSATPQLEPGQGFDTLKWQGFENLAKSLTPAKLKEAIGNVLED